MEAELDRRDPWLRLSASARQIERVEMCCRALGTPSPIVSGKLSRTDAKAFLDAHTWFNPPTERQIAYARSISELLGVEITKERGVLTFASVCMFIREHVEQFRLMRDDHESERQLRYYEGETYAGVQRAAFNGVDFGEI